MSEEIKLEPLAEDLVNGLAESIHERLESDAGVKRPFIIILPNEKAVQIGSNMQRQAAATCLIKTLESLEILPLDEGGLKAVEKLNQRHAEEMEDWNRRVQSALHTVHELSGQLIDTYRLLDSLRKKGTLNRTHLTAVIEHMDDLERNLEGAKTMRACYESSNAITH